MQTSREYTQTEKNWIWLSKVKGLGPVGFMRILNEAVDIDFFFDHWREILPDVKLNANVSLEVEKAMEEPGIDEFLAGLEKEGICAVCRMKPEYPELLSLTPTPPAVLYVKGALERMGDKCVSIVGTRRCSKEGYEFVRALAEDLAIMGVTVVSGMARGIDTAAHEGALAGGGVTVAVLAGGADDVYPPENAGLYEKIAKTGAIVSENPPGFPVLSRSFHARNRIIAGLSPVLYVGEAPEKSGAAVTVMHATGYDRIILTTKGDSPLHALGAALIESGCKSVSSAAQIMSELDWKKETARPAADLNGGIVGADAAENKKCDIKLDFLESELYNLLLIGHDDIDALSSELKLTSQKLMSTITTLEIKGVLRRLPGRKVALI